MVQENLVETASRGPTRCQPALEMRTKTTITLLVFTCLLVGLVLLMRGNKPSTSEAPSSLLPIDVDRITQLTLAQSTAEIECIRTGTDWTIARPAKARANAAAIDRILRTLGDMQRVESITAAQRRGRGLTLEDYGVGEKPRARLTLGNTRTNLTLLLGRDALDNILYARFADQDNVLTTKAGILSVLPQNLDDLRDRNLVRGDGSFVSRLEIARPSSGFIQATKKDGQWTMLQPVKGARLNNEKVKKILKLLHEAQVERFIPSVDPGKTGLDEAQATMRITVWTGDDAAGQQLLLGRPDPDHKNELFAKLADSECVCTVKKGILDAFNVKTSELRDSTVFPMSSGDARLISFHTGERKLEFHRNGDEWQIVAPRHMKTDAAVMTELLTKLFSIQVEEFVEPVELASGMGLAPAPRSIEISTGLPADGEAPDPKKDTGLRKVLLIGNEVAGGQSFYARFEDESSVLKVSREPMRSILDGRHAALPVPVCAIPGGASSNTWINPLLYCNRIMLALDRDSVSGISLLREKREQAIFREKGGDWQPVPPMTGKVNVDVASDVLDAASRLEAMEIKSEGGENPASFGLDESAARLTFGLADGKGIRKTLLIGFRAGSNGVYAMVQGQDVIFVLPMKLVGKLLRDLVPEEAHGS